MKTYFIKKYLIKRIILIGIMSFPLLVMGADYQFVYREALDITKNNFYDSSMNNQHWNYWQERYANKLKSKEDLTVAITSSLASLDDIYTRYLPEASYKEELQDIHGEGIKSVYNKPRYFRTKIPKHIRYLRIDSMMNKKLPCELKNIITEAEKDPVLKGYIIDLRDNGGGLAKNATDIASLFMNDKIVLYAQTNKNLIKNATSKDKAITSKPVVIIINGYTASACEVFSSAMQDNKRAIIVGSTSYGKGVIQKIFKLSDGSGLHVTVMNYYTPENKPINKIGIVPDKTVWFTKKDIFLRRDVQLLEAVKVLQKM